MNVVSKSRQRASKNSHAAPLATRDEQTVLSLGLVYAAINLKGRETQEDG